jgi:hypothetical protein
LNCIEPGEAGTIANAVTPTNMLDFIGDGDFTPDFDVDLFPCPN